MQPGPQPSPEASTAAPPGPSPTGAAPHLPLRRRVPDGLVLASEWTARSLVVAFGAYLLLAVLERYALVSLSIIVALLVAALLKPGVDVLASTPHRRRLPRPLATVAVMLAAGGALGGLVAVVGGELVDGLPRLAGRAEQGWLDAVDALAGTPLDPSTLDLDDLGRRFGASLQEDWASYLDGAADVASGAAEVVTGIVLVVFTTYFFLADGPRIWGWLLGWLPTGARDATDGAGHRAWTALTGSVRGAVVIAAVDGLGVTAVAAVLGVPLALPLGVIVFLGAFVPVVGGLVAGLLAVLVAFAAQGPAIGLAMLVAVIALPKIEANLLQPLVLGRTVHLHPLAIIVAVALGVLAVGAAGALLAVPVAAVGNAVATYLRARAADTRATDGAGQATATRPTATESTSTESTSTESTSTETTSTETTHP